MTTDNFKILFKKRMEKKEESISIVLQINSKWEKTIRMLLPLLTNEKTARYIAITSKEKIINNEEELLSYFFAKSSKYIT